MIYHESAASLSRPVLFEHALREPLSCELAGSTDHQLWELLQATRQTVCRIIVNPDQSECIRFDPVNRQSIVMPRGSSSVTVWTSPPSRHQEADYYELWCLIQSLAGSVWHIVVPDCADPTLCFTRVAATHGGAS